MNINNKETNVPYWQTTHSDKLSCMFMTDNLLQHTSLWKILFYSTRIYQTVTAYLSFTKNQLQVKLARFMPHLSGLTKLRCMLMFRQPNLKPQKMHEKIQRILDRLKLIAVWQHLHSNCITSMCLHNLPKMALRTITQHVIWTCIQHTRASTVRFAINFCLWVYRHRHKAWNGIGTAGETIQVFQQQHSCYLMSTAVEHDTCLSLTTALSIHHLFIVLTKPAENV